MLVAVRCRCGGSEVSEEKPALTQAGDADVYHASEPASQPVAYKIAIFVSFS